MNNTAEKQRSASALRKRIRKLLFISVPVYLCCLLVGAACIFIVHARSNISLRDNAQRAAQSIIKGEDYEDTYSSRSMMLYLYEDGLITSLQDKEARRNYEACIERYASRSLDGEVHYRIVAVGSPLSFAVMASAPVSDTQVLFIFQSDRSLRPTLTILLIVITLVFIIVLAYTSAIFKKNEKINEIYRCYCANISHELKSPAASIRALTEALSEGFVTDEAQKSHYYGMIISETRVLERSVKSIMELSRIQEHREDFSCTAITPERLFNDVCRKYEELCAEMDIYFETDDSVYSLPALYTNRDRVCQVLDILISNSVKFLDDERAGHIILYARAGRRMAEICVKDNGIGIAPDDLEHVFERFFKSNLSHNNSGSGLGLAIANEIVKELGGEIRAESTPGRGSVFCFTIRVAGR